MRNVFLLVAVVFVAPGVAAATVWSGPDGQFARTVFATEVDEIPANIALMGNIF